MFKQRLFWIRGIDRVLCIILYRVCVCVFFSIVMDVYTRFHFFFFLSSTLLASRGHTREHVAASSHSSFMYYRYTYTRTRLFIYFLSQRFPDRNIYYYTIVVLNIL